MLKFSQPCNPGLRGKGRLRLVDLFSRSHNNHQSIALLEADGDTTISGLDDALHILHKLGGLYGKLTPDEQRSILVQLVEKVTVDLEGRVLYLDLHPPFGYIAERYDEAKKRLANRKTKSVTPLWRDARGQVCSEPVQLCWETWIRTRTSGTRIRGSAVKLSPTNTQNHTNLVPGLQGQIR